MTTGFLLQQESCYIFSKFGPVRGTCRLWANMPFRDNSIAMIAILRTDLREFQLPMSGGVHGNHFLFE